jgi:hypothetical protein
VCFTIACLALAGTAGYPHAARAQDGSGARESPSAAGAPQSEEEGWEEDEAGGDDAASEEEPAPPEASEPAGASGAPGAQSSTANGGTASGDEGEASEQSEGVEGQSAGLQPAAPVVRFQDLPSTPGENDFSFVLPPFMYERQRANEAVGLFPLFFYRQSPLSTELAIPPYYLQRGPANWDVLFPLFWWYRGEGHHTWIVPPVWSHESSDGFDFGIAPFVMTGRHHDRHYTLIPPLLTVDWGDEHERFTFAALFWRVQERFAEHWGLFPLLWAENTESTSYVIQPPFFFRFENRDEGTTLTVVPPFYHRDEPTGSYFGVPPLFHHNSGPGHTSTTIFPLLTHYSESADVTRLVAGGLVWWWRDHGDETLVTPFYQRFRGATEMDAVAPFFFSVRDPRTGYSALAIPPLVWHFEDPASSVTAVLPFYANIEQRGRSSTWITPLVANHRDLERNDETTWVFPTIQISRWHNGDAVNIHPIWYYESVPDHRFTVFAPLYFDFEFFEGTRNRYTVVAPFFWRFREGNTTSTLVFNVYHRERVRSDGSDWEFHFAPFFSYGESSRGDHWWKVFFGLAGYERRGPYGITTLFYVPFQTDGPPLPAASPSSSASSSDEEAQQTGTTPRRRSP